jgi:DMSO/TMAO reductase YedYZ molybdopterin-dependent catalytic subunit
MGKSRYDVALGLGSAALALGIGEIVGVALADVSIVASVGDVAVDMAPGWLVRRTIGLLGTAQKPVLLAGIVGVALLVGARVGSLGGRGRLAFGLGATVGALAAFRSGIVVGGATAAAAAAGSGITSLRVGRCLEVRAGTPSPEQSTPDSMSIEDPKVRAASRRGFLGYASGLTVAGGALALGSRVLSERASASYRDMVLPTVRRTDGDRPTPTTTTEGSWRPPDGLSTWVTPNSDFYRIDTALVIPRIDPAGWAMRVDGMVDRPITFTLDDLLARDLMDATVTLSCVSNEVGGHLVGNAVWTGVPLIELLEEAGVRPDGQQVMGRSVDGFSAGFPRSVLDDARTALVAVGMNGEPLPFRHGFPARLVIAGLYGYVSAVKWLERIELTAMSVDGYWIPRGWAKEAPIKIASRIDVPLRSQTVSGRQAVAGVAWAPVSGVEAVELAVDDGPWEECRLERGLGPGHDGESWVQWSTVWDAPPGDSKLRVRAWNRAGQVQPEGPKYIAPDGAEGYHARRIVVI